MFLEDFNSFISKYANRYVNFLIIYSLVLFFNLSVTLSVFDVNCILFFHFVLVSTCLIKSHLVLDSYFYNSFILVSTHRSYTVRCSVSKNISLPQNSSERSVSWGANLSCLLYSPGTALWLYFLTY